MNNTKRVLAAVALAGAALSFGGAAQAGTGIGQSISTDNGSRDGVVRNDRILNNNQETDSSYEGVVPVALGKLGLE
ncbi:hypothetical protein [Streptomyces aureus]|uniref:hypothetical protein n=1 Tax=Streptomyces aureus TaxID=193461 RepID=UPI0006E39D43|nr:hypothetical protein [Streptomyces aureus]